MSKHKVVASLSRVPKGANADLSVRVRGADDPGVVSVTARLVEPMAGGLEVEYCEPNPYVLNGLTVRLLAVERCPGGRQGIVIDVRRDSDEPADGHGPARDGDTEPPPGDDDDDDDAEGDDDEDDEDDDDAEGDDEDDDETQP